MITRTEFFDYDIVCDRCGKSMVESIRNHIGRPYRLNDDTMEKIISMLLSVHEVLGWRLNPRNQTVVCTGCALIINKKGGE